MIGYEVLLHESYILCSTPNYTNQLLSLAVLLLPYCIRNFANEQGK